MKGTKYSISWEQIGELIDLTENLCFEDSPTDRVQIAKTRIELVNEIRSHVIDDSVCPRYDASALACNCEKSYACLIRINSDNMIVKHTKKKIGDILKESLELCSWLDDRDNGEGCPGKRNGHKSCEGCTDFDVDVWALRSLLEELVDNG